MSNLLATDCISHTMYYSFLLHVPSSCLLVAFLAAYFWLSESRLDSISLHCIGALIPVRVIAAANIKSIAKTLPRSDTQQKSQEKKFRAWYNNTVQKQKTSIRGGNERTIVYETYLGCGLCNLMRAFQSTMFVSAVTGRSVACLLCGKIFMFSWFFGCDFA